MAMGKDKAASRRATVVRLGMTSMDFQAVKYLAKEYARRGGQSTGSAAIRMAVIQQRLTDAVYGCSGGDGPADPVAAMAAQAQLVADIDAGKYLAMAGKIRLTVGLGSRGRAEHGGNESLRQWSMKVFKDVERSLVAVGKVWQIEARADVIRFCVRVQAQLMGFQPPGGVWKV
jgi:hypothetical protein